MTPLLIKIRVLLLTHASEIASRFKSVLTPGSQVSELRTSNIPRNKADPRAVRSWLEGLDDKGEHHDQSLPTLDTTTSIENSFESAVYRWLTESLRKELLLAPVHSQERSGSLRSQVVQHLCSATKIRVSSKRPSDILMLKLRVDWHPATFLREEFSISQGSLGQLLGKTITLTGSATDAQALPCESYLRQTWPASGPDVLALLGRALDSDDGVEGTLPDRTYVKLDLKPDLRVEIRGTPDGIAEVTEQIAWLGAALRTSDLRTSITGAEEGLSLCSPTLHLSPGLYDGDSPPTHTLTFRTSPIPNEPGASRTGQCWHRLFRDPCIAVGFPIPRRSKYDTGLEIPLTMMACLAQSPRIHHWFGKYLLKGFSTAVVPSQRLDDAILWHLYCSSDGERLPYPDTDAIQWADARGEEIVKNRHILGWCSEAHFYAGLSPPVASSHPRSLTPLLGSKDANYAIRESRLGTAGKDFSLEKVSISVGQILTGGCQFSIGRKDTPIRLSRGGYIDKLRWLRQRYFTLYDVDNSRGFLIDGASTLLHLLRTSLHLSSVDEFASEFVFENVKFQESRDPLKSNSALRVLLNRDNRNLPLYREDVDTCTTVQDRIEQLYETLEKLVDHAHYSEAAHKGVNAVPRMSKHLRGWDFTDLAGDRDPFHLKVIKLPLFVNWVDFTRAIPAVTLFGRGFGALIRAAAHPHAQALAQACLDWMAPPAGQYHLCVGVSDLTAIVQRIAGGDASVTGTSFLTIAPGVACYNPTGGWGGTFSRCVCERTGATSARSRFQDAGLHPVLELASEAVMRRFGGTQGAEIDLESCPRGAVILGTPKWKWPWQSPSASASSSSPSGATEPAQHSLQVVGPVSGSSRATSVSLISASGSAGSAGSATPPTSVASEGSGAGDGDPDTVRGNSGAAGAGSIRIRRGFVEDFSEEDGLGRATSGKRRKMLGKMRETAKYIRAVFVKGTAGEDGDVEMELR